MKTHSITLHGQFSNSADKELVQMKPIEMPPFMVVSEKAYRIGTFYIGIDHQGEPVAPKEVPIHWAIKLMRRLCGVKSRSVIYETPTNNGVYEICSTFEISTGQLENDASVDHNKICVFFDDQWYECQPNSVQAAQLGLNYLEALEDTDGLLHTQ